MNIQELLGDDDQAWMREGYCADSGFPDRWFPTEQVESASYCEALCGGCPSRIPCLRYAMDRPELEGVWGGVSAWQRKKLRGTLNTTCGTYGGYLRHRKSEEPACEPCLAANAERSRLKRQKRSSRAA